MKPKRSKPTISEQFVQFFVIPDGELQVTRDDTLLLVVSGSVASEFENLSGKIFKDW